MLVLFVAGCEPSAINLPNREPVREPAKLGEQFDPAACGSLRGTVHWDGDVPASPVVKRPLSIVASDTLPNPNMLHLDENKYLAGAVVMLRGVDPARSKPWNHLPVEMELHDGGITIHQGDSHGRTGIVRRDDKVILRASSEKSVGVRGRGADFFSQILPPSHNRAERVFNSAGRVELTSASGQFWANADLIVSDHPYVAITNAAGEYRFDHVPPGEYEVVVMHANPAVARNEIDPESGLLVRQQYQPPFEMTYRMSVDRSIKVLNFALTANR